MNTARRHGAATHPGHLTPAARPQPGARTRLVISVRNRFEAKRALAAGADLIDVKEPSRGSLGCCDAAVVAEIVREIAGQAPVSAALGELGDWSAPWRSLDRWWRTVRRIRWTKIGLSGCRERPDWSDAWRQLLARRPGGVTPLAVVYADWLAARAPAPDVVLDQAGQVGCPILLVDTFDKSKGSLTDHWPLGALQSFVEEVHSRQLQIVLAGSLSVGSLPEVLALKPDFVALRGAVCDRGRTGSVRRQRVAAVARLLTSQAKATYSAIALQAGTRSIGRPAAARTTDGKGAAGRVETPEQPRWKGG